MDINFKDSIQSFRLKNQKQGLGFSSKKSYSENAPIPARGSALPSASSFLNKFVKASSPKKESELPKQAQIESIQNKLKRKKPDLAKEEKEKEPLRVSQRDDRHSRKRSRSRSRSRERHLRRRSRSREKYRDRERRRKSSRSGSDLDRGRRRRGRSRSRSPRDWRKERWSRSSLPRERGLEKSRGKAGKERNAGVADYSKLIQGNDTMSADERVRAKMKLQLAETCEFYNAGVYYESKVINL